MKDYSSSCQENKVDGSQTRHCARRSRGLTQESGHQSAKVGMMLLLLPTKPTPSGPIVYVSSSCYHNLRSFANQPCRSTRFSLDARLGRGLVFDDEIAGTAQQRIRASDAISGKQRSKRKSIRSNRQFRGSGGLSGSGYEEKDRADVGAGQGSGEQRGQGSGRIKGTKWPVPFFTRSLISHPQIQHDRNGKDSKFVFQGPNINVAFKLWRSTRFSHQLKASTSSYSQSRAVIGRPWGPTWL